MYGNRYKNILENLDIIKGLKSCRNKKEARKYLKSKDIDLTHTQLHELKDIYCSNTENFEALSFETLSSVAAGNMVAIRGGKVHLIRGIHFEGEPQSENIELFYDAHHSSEGLPAMVKEIQLETMIIGKIGEKPVTETESKAVEESQLINLSTSEIKELLICNANRKEPLAHNIDNEVDLEILSRRYGFSFEEAKGYLKFDDVSKQKIGSMPKTSFNMKSDNISSDTTLSIRLEDPTFLEHGKRSQSVPLEKMHMGDLSDRLSEQNPTETSRAITHINPAAQHDVPKQVLVTPKQGPQITLSQMDGKHTSVHLQVEKHSRQSQTTVSQSQTIDKERFVLPHEDDSQVQVNLDLRPKLKEGKDGYVTIETRNADENIRQLTTEVAQPERSEETAARAAQSILVDDEVPADEPPVLPEAHEDMVIVPPVAHEVALDLDTVRNQARTFISDNHLDDSAREAINSVFHRYGDYLDQLLLAKLSKKLTSKIESDIDSAVKAFEFLAEIADPQKANTELLPDITYGKFYRIITGQDKVTLKILNHVELDLREVFIDLALDSFSLNHALYSRCLSIKEYILKIGFMKAFTKLINESIDADKQVLRNEEYFPYGNDVVFRSGGPILTGICQMTPEYFDFFFKACQNMTRISKFVIEKLNFGQVRTTKEFIAKCFEKFETISYAVGEENRGSISDMEDNWFAIKLIAACESKGIELDANSLKYDAEGRFTCVEALRRFYLEEGNKPKDIDGIINNIDELTLEKLLEKCPEFSALPTTYQIEVLEHWRGEPFTEEEVIRWVFNSPEIFEIEACTSSLTKPYKKFLYTSTMKLLRERLKNNPDKEKYVLAYLRLMGEQDNCFDEDLNFQKGILKNLSYFELLEELEILKHDALRIVPVSVNGLFAEDQELTIAQQIFRFYLFPPHNCRDEISNVVALYVTGEFEAIKATRFTRAVRAENTRAKRAVEYLVLNYDQLTPEIRKLILNFALDNITDGSQRKAVENLILPLRGKGREAGSILRDPPAEYNEEQLGYFRNLSSRRTEILELQLETILADDEYGKLLRVHTKEADARKLEISSEQENLRKQIASSREIDQKAIAILPSTIKEKEEAENKKLMNGFIIGTGVLGITGISVLAVLKSLGVIGAAAAAVAASAASTNSQNNNDDDKNNAA